MRNQINTGAPSNAPAWVHVLESIWQDINGLELATAAVLYAECGIPVFPLQPGSKVPYKGTRGCKEASTDMQRVLHYWQKEPHSNIGIATGYAFNVLDVDTKNGAPGWASLRKLNTHRLLGGAFAQAQTPSEGCHLLFTPAEGQGNYVSGKAGHGLDFRGVGGYVVAAPSKTEQGEYQWTGFRTGTYGTPFAWDKAHGVLSPPTVAKKQNFSAAGSASSLSKFVSEAREGNRNAALHWAAMRAIESGLDPRELLAPALQIGLSLNEAERTIQSAERTVKP